jgi:hypothetical protein
MGAQKTRCPPGDSTDPKLGPATDPSIGGNRSYTRAHFLYYAGVVRPGVYR